MYEETIKEVVLIRKGVECRVEASYYDEEKNKFTEVKVLGYIILDENKSEFYFRCNPKIRFLEQQAIYAINDFITRENKEMKAHVRYS